jgi:8-oxo-dGTP diphosphatase
MNLGYVQVCVFIIEHKGQLLLEKRLMSKATDPGKVIFPGGHIDENENPLDACKREIKEELDIECKDYKKICKLYYTSKERKQERQEVHYYTCKIKSGTPKTLEAEKLIWIKPNQFEKLDLDVDRKALKKFIELKTN